MKQLEAEMQLEDALDAIDLEDPAVQDAGLKIQSGFRGMQARKEVKAMRESADGAGQTTDAPVEGGDNTTMEGGSTAPTDAAEEAAPAGEVEEGDEAAPTAE